MTVRQFAALINESHQFVNKVETQQRALKITEYVDYCEALGVSPEEGLKLLKSQK
ncbi:helix-turn-helix domain-containing protein [Alteromonas macleodii]|nr:helix-turn-helix transcriptional regulator [Alteromonas macleodii]USI29655.1 helix-turn-helix domain-containing protein [Alteromonas macleodii]